MNRSLPSISKTLEQRTEAINNPKPNNPIYRIRNGPEYNAALIRRGSFTLWVDEAMLEQGYNTQKSGRRGASNRYSDLAIQCALTLKAVYRLALRATQGFLGSLLELMAAPLRVPHSSTCCRRQATLEGHIPRPVSAGPRHGVVDSTGLKVFGEGKWKVRQHGFSKRRTRRKLHVAVDEATQAIVATLTTTHAVDDRDMLPEWLAQIPEPIEQVSADGADDTRACHEAIAQRRAQAALPPRGNAHPWLPTAGGSMPPRLGILQRIAQVGLAQWKNGEWRPSAQSGRDGHVLAQDPVWGSAPSPRFRLPRRPGLHLLCGTGHHDPAGHA